MEPIRFTGTIRYWDPVRGSGLAVVDVPDTAVAALGGLKQQRVHGAMAGTAFTSNVMPAGGGRLALSVSKQMLSSARLGIGDRAEVEITRVGKD